MTESLEQAPYVYRKGAAGGTKPLQSKRPRTGFKVIETANAAILILG
ncbi:hypothetical protein [Paracoccus sp. (in: a-proteobacteria)]